MANTVKSQLVFQPVKEMEKKMRQTSLEVGKGHPLHLNQRNAQMNATQLAQQRALVATAKTRNGGMRFSS